MVFIQRTILISPCSKIGLKSVYYLPKAQNEATLRIWKSTCKNRMCFGKILTKTALNKCWEISSEYPNKRKSSSFTAALEGRFSALASPTYGDIFITEAHVGDQHFRLLQMRLFVLTEEQHLPPFLFHLAWQHQHVVFTSGRSQLELTFNI